MLSRALPVVACALSLSCAAVAQAEPPAAASRGQDPAGDEPTEEVGELDLDAVFELSSAVRPPSGSFYGWLPDGSGYLALERPPEGEARLSRTSIAADTAPLLDEDAMIAAFSALPGISEELAGDWARGARGYLTADRDAVLINRSSDLFHWRLGAERAYRLTHDPEEEVGEALSPDGKLVAYISDYDLHVVPVDGGIPRPLTDDGDENHLYGRLDWVYQEEVYGRGNFQGFWWSPDSKRIAFLILDETPVPEFTIPDHRQTRPDVEVWRYPKAGDPNPTVQLAVVDLAGGDFRTFDLDDYANQEFLIVRVGWTPDSSEVLFQVQDRIQTWLDVVAGNPAIGATRRLFRDSTGVWIEPTGSPYWVSATEEDGADTFLWLSERDGWRHLYHYDLEGNLLERLTEGEWEVDSVHGHDAERDVVWFSGDKADVKGQQLFRVGLDGSGLTQVTQEPGSHRVSFSPDFSHFVDTFSSHTTPSRVSLYDAEGALVRVLAESDRSLADAYELQPPEFFKVPTRDGFEMEAMMIKPAGYVAGQRYPVVSHTYSGPHAPQVRDTWFNFNGYYHQMLAREGYLIWICDNRSASGKGLESVKGVYKNLGPGELRDLEDGIDWLVAEGYADPERVALWGWSYGGYMTAFALTHSTKFSVGVVGAPVTDWRLYDTIYTERYMDTPQANPEGYASTSVLTAAEDMHGEMLVIHGVIDENVHMQNSLQLAEALQNAGKQFELMLYPGNRHGIVRPAQRRHLYEMMAAFIRDNL